MYVKEENNYSDNLTGNIIKIKTFELREIIGAHLVFLKRVRKIEATKSKKGI